MRSPLVVIAPPSLDGAARIAERIEHLLIQALVAQSTYEALGGHLILLEDLDRRIHLDAAEHPGLVS
jgi:hypothetical protein